MPLALIIPSSTVNANNALISIYNSMPLGSQCILCKDLRDDRINITYGYLGIYSSLFHGPSRFFNSTISFRSFILDHAFAPKQLKTDVFRIARMDQNLTTIRFNQRFLSDSHIDAIYAHLKSLAESRLVNILSPLSNHLSSISSIDSISLLIKKSPVFSHFAGKSNCHNLTNQWLVRRLSKQSALPSLKHLISVKAFEPALSPTGSINFRRSFTHSHVLNYDQIIDVTAPTSMFALNFILHSVPTRLSNSHPLSCLLGDFIPALPSIEAIDLLMESIIRTSVSRENLMELSSYLHSAYF